LVDVPEDAQTISITVPKAKILSHEIHEETLRVLDQKSGLFNTVKIEDYANLATSQKQAMVKKASASDMLTRAENDAVKMLQALIAGIVPAEYTVEVMVGTAP
jgi:acetolactate synthase small subunit